MKFAMYKYSYEHSSTINKILYYFTWPIYQTTFKYIKTVHNICAPRTPAKFFNFEVPDKMAHILNIRLAEKRKRRKKKKGRKKKEKKGKKEENYKLVRNNF